VSATERGERQDAAVMMTMEPDMMAGCPRMGVLSYFMEGTAMLVLSRKATESIQIGDDVTITVVRIGPNTVRLGVTAPKDMNIARTELLTRLPPITEDYDQETQE